MLKKLLKVTGCGALIGRSAAIGMVVVMMICVSALAGSLSGGSRHFFLSEKFKLDDAQNAQSFFLFSQGEITGHEGDIFVFGGNLTVSGTFYGDVFSFFSTIRFNSNNSQKGTVNIFSSKVYAGYSSMKVLPFAGNFDFFYKSYRTPTGLIYDNNISQTVMYVFSIIFDITLSFILLSAKKSFFEQSGLALVNEPVRVLRNGIISYFILLTSAAIFALSIVGFPVTAVIILVTAILSFVGQVSVGYALGRTCLNFFKSRHNETYSNVAVGVIIIQAIKFLPHMRWPMSFLIIPLLGAGTVSTGIINGFIKKKFFYSPDDSDMTRQSSRSGDLRKIILGE